MKQFISFILFYGMNDVASRFSGVSRPLFGQVTAKSKIKSGSKKAWLVGPFSVIFGA